MHHFFAKILIVVIITTIKIITIQVLSLPKQLTNKGHVPFLHRPLHLRHRITNQIETETKNVALIHHDLDHHPIIIVITAIITTVVTNQIRLAEDDDEN